ncbi:MAG: chemotaxis protein CheD [Bacteroidetes bacterium RIFOXYA12_FULL_35_11]|nr:MAG: chemotaxis protein CheD [Bacteroidetes bacterium GWF2_35_48]OFY73831.1 MAG: chemotaxis protein CheD [Bacteroidetes bacterium RIFOXYA12_FULL_35_11]OFZ03185.1 MAG: chemotaxis protein CheD [Bacteroidetes bacterium RIFOXYC12_FULL_35_7]HBX49881.1 chemotaxis protein CheD [Bacteroidales bacterium]
MEIQYSQHYLYPSTLFVNRDPYLISTVLGSCVAVCLYDPILKFGGINHYMLPLWNGEGLASPKYGNIAIKKLIEQMLMLGSKKVSLKAKVFGGGEVIDAGISNFRIGERNIAIAKSMLEEEYIPVLSSSVAGKLGRKIIFNTLTSEVQHKFIERKAF